MNKNPHAASYEDFLDDVLRDPKLAAGYLNEAINENDPILVLMALRNVARAHGIKSIAKALHTQRENVSRMLSARGNPGLANFLKILSAAGLVLQVKAKRALAA